MDKEKLLGSIKPQNKNQISELTSEDLEKLMTSPKGGDDGIMNVFCSGHHGVFSILLEGRTELTNMSGIKEPENWDGKYFQVTRCPFCSEDYLFHDPVLKDLLV